MIGQVVAELYRLFTDYILKKPFAFPSVRINLWDRPTFFLNMCKHLLPINRQPLYYFIAVLDDIYVKKYHKPFIE